MMLFGHRGASFACPENTKAAYESALTGDSNSHTPVDGVECDLHLLGCDAVSQTVHAT